MPFAPSSVLNSCFGQSEFGRARRPTCPALALASPELAHIGPIAELRDVENV